MDSLVKDVRTDILVKKCGISKIRDINIELVKKRDINMGFVKNVT